MKSYLFILAIFCSSILVNAQETNQNDYQKTTEMKDWGFSITPYAMLAAQSTNVGQDKIRQSFGDLAGMTSAGFQLIVGARYKRLKLGFDVTWATLGGALDQGPSEYRCRN